MVEIKRLLNDYVVVKVDDIKAKTDSGLYVPEQIKTYPSTGVITHKARDLDTNEVAVGDRVQFKVYASIDIDKGVVAIPISGIIAVIE